MKRATLFYVITLPLAVLGIMAVLHLGSDLPVPQASGAGVSAKPAKEALQGGEASAVATMMHSLQENFQDPLSRLFVQLILIIAASRLLGKAAGWIGQPAVVGEMAAGILLGPSLFGMLSPEAFHFVFPPESLGSLKLLSQVGVCFFMFSVGMELNIAQLRSKTHTAVVVSHASIVMPYLLGVVLAYFLYSHLAAQGASFMAFALFMGISMSITAFPVLARILQEKQLSRTYLGTTAITCAAVDDVTAWSMLAFVVAVARASSVGACALNLLIIVIFVAIMIYVVRKFLVHWLRDSLHAEADLSKGALALVVCVVVCSALCTEVLGIHALFGAFLAGAIMPDAGGFRHKLMVRVENFSSVLLLPLFFAFTGLRTQVNLLNGASDWLLCILIIGVATLGKLGGSSFAARFTGMSWSESLQLGALMNTRGLMELIALNIGYDLGILSPRIFTMLVLMALVTTFMTSPLLTLFGKKQPVVGGGDAGLKPA